MTNTFKNYITLENGKRSGQPCIRGMRITVGDILAMLGNGMSISEIQEEYDELTQEDILAVLQYAAYKQNHAFAIAV
jgi:uncharacterized protein (DUF433 family)